MKRMLALITLTSSLLLLAPPMAAETMLDAYAEAAKTVPEHKRLAELAGKWNVTTKFWMDPAKAPSITTGKATNTLVLGGRFLSSAAQTAGGGLSYEALTIFGFDRRTDDYTLTGYDSMGTYSIAAAGKFDALRNGVALAGSYLQPPEMKEQQYLFVWSHPSKDLHIFTL
ncbi:MAG TPA: DUF1579 family protein, partial [Thermoanaerobaculia bacterium]|nr:DUF1579 family protein [Thermoanaerobaculia bacterium]